MSSSKVLEYLKIDDPAGLSDEYLDDSIDRSRKPKPEVTGKWHQLLGVFDWYPSYYSEYERTFLKKVDLSVLLFTAFSFFTKYLDSSNITNAYVSGMKEELNLHGNELNYFGSFFNAGYCIFQIPLVLLVQKQAFARYLLIVCELCWGLCTFAASNAQNAHQLYVVRFLIGVSEAVSFPGSYVIMSTWYTPEELVRRAGFYNLMSSVGTISSGLLQSACREYLDGVGGRSGWRWQFVIDGIITIASVVYGLFMFPGTPETTKKFGILNEDDLVFARKRMRRHTARPQEFSLLILQQIFKTWQPYCLVVLWVGHHLVNYESDLKIYIRSLVPEKYSPSAPTNFAAVAGVFSGVFAFFTPSLSAVYGLFPVVTVAIFLGYYSSFVLAKWDVPHPVRLSAYFTEELFLSGLAPTFYAWAANLCKESPEKKLFVLALINTLAYATRTWSVPLQWNTKYAPQFHVAYRINIGMMILVNFMFVVVWVLERYDAQLIPKFAGDRNLTRRDSADEELLLTKDGDRDYSSTDLRAIGKDDDNIKNAQIVTVTSIDDSRKLSV